MMRNWINQWLWGRIFHPRNRRLFRLRIWLRVRWLLLGHWWKEDVSLRALAGALPRPLAVALVGIGIPYLVFALLDRGGLVTADAIGKANPFKATGPMEWRAAIQPLLLLIGVPAAFILWAFRDHHVLQTLENQRKDVNLKEFQEIQMRAAGALDEKLAAEGREALQIAALHQLRAFLRGDFGRGFRRPAFELLLAGQRASMDRIGLAKALDDWREQGIVAASVQTQISDAMRDADRARTAVDRARLDVMAQEWHRIFRARFPLSGRNFAGLNFPAEALLAELDLRSICFAGANLSWAHLEGAVLFKAHLEGANLHGARLEGANLSGAHLESADLGGAQLEGASLSGAHLEGAFLSGAHFEGASLSGAHLEGAFLYEAHLEGAYLSNAHLEGADLSEARLEGAYLFTAQFTGANLSWAHLEGADLQWAQLEGANLLDAHLEGANLREAHLEGADLQWAQLEGANLLDAHLEGANLREAHLEGANLRDAIIDDRTILLLDWDECSPEDRAAAQQKLRDLGARHVYDPPAE